MNPASAPFLVGALPSQAHPQLAGPRHETPPNHWPVAVLGVPFDHVTIEEAVARIDAMIATRRPHYVVTANVDFLVQAHRDVELRRILLEADLVLCDGTPVLWASRWLGNALPERVAGSDLAPALVQSAAEKGHRLFLLGAAEGVATDAEARLRQAYPTLDIVGTYAPPYSRLLEMDHDEMSRRIRAAKPDLLLVSFGCPKQEKWIAMHHRSLGVPVAIGVGATLDFLAGRVKRAPAWMKRTGTEWVYRLVQEPRRLYRRYANDLLYFLPTLVAQTWRLNAGGAMPDRPGEKKLEVADWCGVDAGERLTRRSLEESADFWQTIRARDAHCVIDLSRIRHVDGTGVAFLIRCRKELLNRGRHLVLLSPSKPLLRTLAAMRLSDHFVIASDVAQAVRRAESLLTPAIRRDDATRSLAWCGEIVAANSDDVWRMTTEHILEFVRQDATLVIVDLARLRFIDSSGVGLMLRIKKWSQALRVEVLFAHPQPNVRNVLRLTCLEQMLLGGAQ